MKEYLIFQIYGPMASWGNIAVGERRASYSYPSKSAVLGLLAAACGIKRNEEARLSALANSLGFAVRVDALGNLLRDYHTTQVPSRRKEGAWSTRRDELGEANLNTILSGRDYRVDALYTIAVWVNRTSELGIPCPSLTDLREALLRPKFVLYLGRKCCPPALPLNPCLVEKNTLREALEEVKWPCHVLRDLRKIRRESKTVAFYWEQLSDSEAGMASNFRNTRHDQLTSRKRWQFCNRYEFCRLESAGEENS